MKQTRWYSVWERVTLPTGRLMMRCICVCPVREDAESIAVRLHVQGDNETAVQVMAADELMNFINF